MDTVDELNKEPLTQPFCKDGQLPEELNEYKRIAYNYARIENPIAVLGDMRTNTSYIYYGGTTETLGIARKGDNQNLEPVQEKKVFKHIHPDNLTEKHVQELRFYHLLKRTPHRKRADCFLTSKPRIYDSSGKHVPILRRIFCVATHSNDSMWPALCLYDLSIDPIMSCRVISPTDGQVIEPEKQNCNKLLSDREKTVLQLVDMGKTDHEVVRELFISKNTVSRHRRDISKKPQVKNSIEVCRVAKGLRLLFRSILRLPFINNTVGRL